MMFMMVAFGFFVLVVAALSVPVRADPSPPTSLSVLSSGGRQLPAISTSNVSAQGGNVTNVNIDALTITKSWQGYYGNVTGNIHLDDANNNSFYIWGNASSLAGEIYASRNNTIDWGTINCTTGAERSAEDGYLGLSWSDGDSATNTFNGTIHPGFLVGSQDIGNNTCYSTTLFVNGTSQNDSFHQILLSDSSGSLVYSTIMEDNQYAYNGQTADFQLLVGENEHPSALGPTTYYFFVEIN